MMRSMTAFAASECEIDDWLFSWEIRTVNHRYFDLSLRLPETFRFMEPEVRNRIGSYIKRGRVDCILSWKRTQQREAHLSVNRELVETLLAVADQVRQWSPSPLAPFTALDVLTWPGALGEPEADRERLSSHALALLDQALQRIVTARETEGRQLGQLVAERCNKIKEHVAAVKLRVPEVLQGIRQRISARLTEVTANPDSDRLAQEMVYLAQKLDVAEELDRLDTHTAELLRSLQANGPVGRRLDFLLQELNREANTLGSKSADTVTTAASVEIKVLIEQMREQVQNIE